MSRLLISTALAGLLFSAGAVVAQPHDDHGMENHAPGGAPSAPRPAAQHQAPQHQAPQHQQAAQRPQHAAPPAVHPAAMLGNAFTPNNNNNNNNNNQQNNNRPQNNGGDRGGDRGGAGDHRTDNRPAAGQQNAPRPPQNAMRGPGQGHAMRGAPARPSRDFTSYRRNFNAPRRYRGPAYQRPSGWYAHRWVYGETLPSLFWSRNYWLNDYVNFGLMSPPPGTVWVRDGSDALLIDQYNGQIVQVAYNVFY